MKKIAKVTAAAALSLSMVFAAGAVFTINHKNVPVQ